MNEKTIAIIGESFGATGKGLYPIELSKAINKISKKYKIKLFMRDTAPYDSEFVVKIKTFKTKKRIFAGLGYYIPLFFKLRKDKSIDIIHAYDEKTSILASFLKKPLIVTVYDLFPLQFNKLFFKSLFDRLYRLLARAKSIITISSYTGDLLSNKFPFLSKKITPIHLGVDIDRFKPIVQKKKICINIGILCNLDKELWNVFERILQEYGKRVKIIIGGRDIPKEFNYLKSYPGVIFKGFVPESELPKHYQNIDIFVYKTNVEGFGLIPLEAMASGCAVITSNVDSLPEVVKNGGILVGNTGKDFYEAIKKMIDNKNLRLEHQRKGRKRAEELTWNKCAKKHLNLYKKVLDK